MKLRENLHHPERYWKILRKWSLLGALMGAIGGFLGAFFHHALHFVTHLRFEHPWLIFLLPLGGLLGSLIGLDPGFAAALALVGLFCRVTNSHIASIFLSIAMFGGANVYLFAFVCVIAFVISDNWSLYHSQIIQFSKSRFVKRNFQGE